MAEQVIPVKLPDGRTMYLEDDPENPDVQDMIRTLQTEGLDPGYERFAQSVGADLFKKPTEDE